jgi:hypothetical protein
MFFSAEDTKWFMPVKLRTEFGLIGQIRETLGTKGHFRCAFSDFVKADRHDLHAPVQATVPPSGCPSTGNEGHTLAHQSKTIASQQLPYQTIVYSFTFELIIMSIYIDTSYHKKDSVRVCDM